MIITKMALSRRTFLRGIGGIAIGLPLFDAMVPALTATARTAANPTRRLGFLYLPNGVAMNDAVNYWRPLGTGGALDLSPILTPLAPFRDQMLVVSGLKHAQAEAMGDGNGDHTRGTATWLNGVHPKFTQGSDVRAGTTADQVAAAELGKETAIPSLELAVDLNFLVGNCDNGYSCSYMNTVSWRSPTTPLPTENNPRLVFERLFGDGGTPDQRIAQLRKDRSILDAVSEDMVRLQRKLGPTDRAKANDYFDSVREVERRIQKAEANTDVQPPAGLEHGPVGIPATFGDHVRLMFDLQWLAYQADITRVFTFMFGREVGSRTYPEIGITEGHHGLSHHGDRPDALEKLAKVNTYQATLFASFLEKMRATPDGDGSLLDHSLLLYGASLSNPNVHSHVDLPLVVVGGGAGSLRGGRHLVAAKEPPMTNLLVSILDKAGVHVDKLGDSDGHLPLEPLSDV